MSYWLQLAAGMPQGSYLGPMTSSFWWTHCDHDVWPTSLSVIRRWRRYWTSQQSAACRYSLTNSYNKQLTLVWMWMAKRRKKCYSAPFSDLPLPVSLSGTPVERVTTLKLLGVHVANDLKWLQHVDAISSKVSSKLYFSKQLKRSGAGPVFLCRGDTPSVALEPHCCSDKALESL